MIRPRAALALLAVVCAPVAPPGCPSGGLQGTPPGLFARTPRPLTAPRDRSRHARPIEAFTIVFSTFIPSNYVLGPRVHPQSFCGVHPPRRLAFAGDDRGFDVDSTCYRAK